MSEDLGQKMTERMTKSERDQSFPDSEPRDAATLMLIDRADEAQPKVLLGRRHANHKFMPGKFVFPGGRIEAADRLMPAASELPTETQKKLLTRVADTSPAYARAFPLAALRETCEETGLILGIKREPAPQVPGDDWADFARASIFPDLAHIHFIARAITPPRRPKRFDTRFFTADATHIAHRIDGIVSPNAELVELVWAPIAEAAKFDMPTITSVILEELGARVAAGMGRELPVPFYFMEGQRFFRELL